VNDATFEVLTVTLTKFQVFAMLCHIDVSKYFTLKCLALKMKALRCLVNSVTTRVGTLIVATIYLQLIQNRYMFRSFTVLQCSHQHCVQPVASDVEVVGYL